MRKHTAGPWRVSQDGTRIVAGANGLHIAQVATQGMGFAADANAALLATSPEMLESLELLIQHVLHYVAMPNAHADAHKHAANARAVIAKATGQQT